MYVVADKADACGIVACELVETRVVFVARQHVAIELYARSLCLLCSNCWVLLLCFLVGKTSCHNLRRHLIGLGDCLPDRGSNDGQSHKSLCIRL